VPSRLDNSFFFHPVDVDNFINDHKDGWISDAGLPENFLLLNKAKFKILLIGIRYEQN